MPPPPWWETKDPRLSARACAEVEREREREVEMEMEMERERERERRKYMEWERQKNRESQYDLEQGASSQLPGLSNKQFKDFRSEIRYSSNLLDLACYTLELQEKNKLTGMKIRQISSKGTAKNKNWRQKRGTK